MYTQCPECSTAFRVTAMVLKQAAGKVRCGGCGHAFNALEYLSEAMPDQPAANDVDENLPELKPEPLKAGDGLPASISAEQSAALLKTLDELAGSDIRIEDTGVEWRVLDDEELGESPVDEILEESPTPVDQFLTETPAQIDAPEIFDAEAEAPSQTPVDELRFDDNTPLPDDFDFGNDSPPVPEPDEEPEADEEIQEAAADPQPDVDLSEPGEWTDILDEFGDLGSAAPLPLDEELAALDEEIADEEQAEPEEPEELAALDEEIADEEQTEPEELEELAALDEEIADDEQTEPEELEELAALDGEIADEEQTEPEEPDEPEEPEADSEGDGEALLDMDTQFALQAEAMGIDLSGIHEMTDEAADAEDEPGVEVDEAVEEADQLELIDDADEQPDDEYSDVEYSDVDEPDVPPSHEGDQSIDMQIDADLMAIAVEDEDGFASTIIISDGEAEEALLAKASVNEGESDDAGDETAEDALKDTSAGFESIIMEGDHILSGLDGEQANVEEDRAAVAALVGAAAAEREAEQQAAKGDRRWALIAGAVALTVLFALQAVHQKRDVLAKIPAFNNVVGPIYRVIGQPLAPDWDITGWRFETTKGSTDDGEQNLTIYSRLGNELDEPLPYPLIAISLTDRFEETVGSRILDPTDYLASDLDPGKLVQPGNTFNAVMTIAAPDPEATGFKLNVCYRDTGDDLRCAIDDFK
ncbi:MAG: DUF3426 domain-containing protein [Woeseiaceae bacterium]|nr:DUF3426 domain-containing protein [Woeseiaceae bacterium]